MHQLCRDLGIDNTDWVARVKEQSILVHEVHYIQLTCVATGVHGTTGKCACASNLQFLVFVC